MLQLCMLVRPVLLATWHTCKGILSGGAVPRMRLFPAPLQVMQEELGRPVHEVYSEITPEPVAAASLGQVRRACVQLRFGALRAGCCLC